jgi:hypothetical protein
MPRFRGSGAVAGSGLPSGGDIGDILVNTAPGEGEWTTPEEDGGTTRWFRGTGTDGLIFESAFGAPNKMGTATVVTDTEEWWNAGLGRYIPQVAGLYLVTVGFAATSAYQTGTAFTDIGFFKNGVVQPDSLLRVPAGANTYGPVKTMSGKVSMNGTTDHIEACGGIGRASSATTITGLTTMTVTLL